MIYPEFDKYTIENLQQQLCAISARVVAVREQKKKILDIDFQPAVIVGEEARIAHLRAAENQLYTDTTLKNKIQFEIQSRCEELGIDPPPYNL